MRRFAPAAPREQPRRVVVLGARPAESPGGASLLIAQRHKKKPILVTVHTYV
jgi:hypothetical protein